MSDTTDRQAKQDILNRPIEIGDEIEEISSEIALEISNSVWVEELPITEEFLAGLLDSIATMRNERTQLEQEALGLLATLT
jgi:serine protease inhibitor